MQAILFRGNNDIVLKRENICHIHSSESFENLRMAHIRNNSQIDTNTLVTYPLKVYKRGELYESFTYDFIFEILRQKLEIEDVSLAMFFFDKVDDKNILCFIVDFLNSLNIKKIEIVKINNQISIKVDEEPLVYSFA